MMVIKTSSLMLIKSNRIIFSEQSADESKSNPKEKKQTGSNKSSRNIKILDMKLIYLL